MLSNASQYSPQGLMNPFPGLQAAGSPQMSPGLFGQPGANGAYASDPTQAGQGPPYPFGAQANPFMQNPFTLQNPFTQSQFLQANPYLQSQLLQGSLVHNPLLSSFAGAAGAHNPTQHAIALLGQLAQHLSMHALTAQQISLALHQLTQQLAMQSGGSLGAGQGSAGAGQPYAGAGQGFSGAGQPYAGAGQPFGFGGPFAGSPGAGQYFGQNPFGAQGGYAGFNPQGQAWSANRPQTIQ